MTFYFLTGKLGSGKNLMAVSRIRDALDAGKPVATNIDLDLAALCPKGTKSVVYRVPDYPSASDLDLIGKVDNDDDEERNGLLVLDEGAMLFNSRSWSDKQRQALIDWFLLSRKAGWDCIILAQSFAVLDKQMRETLGEYVVYMKRWDRLAIPLVGRLGRLLTFGLWSGKFPRIHSASVMYGYGADAMFSESWHCRGNGLFGCYPTKQRFSRAYEAGVFCMLPGSSLVPVKRPKVAPAPSLPLRKPKLRTIQLLAALPRDEAWRLARRYVERLPSRQDLVPSA